MVTYFMIVISAVMGLLIGISASYFSIKDSLLPSLASQIPISWCIPLLFGILLHISLIVSSIYTLKFKNRARVLLIVLMLWNLFIGLGMQVITAFNIRFPFGHLIHDYIIPLWSVFFATDSLVFRMGFDDPWVGFNYGASFFLRISLCIIIILCLIRPKVKEQFRKYETGDRNRQIPRR